MLNGQVAIVTGASRGIGEAIAARSRVPAPPSSGPPRPTRAPSTSREAIAEAGGKGAGRVLDVRDAAACAAFADKVAAEFGPVAILVNNAGVDPRQPARAHEGRGVGRDPGDQPEERLRAVSRAVLRGMMKARAGRIVNITSVVGLHGQPGPGQLRGRQGRASSASPSRSRARWEAATSRSTASRPGFIETDMTRSLAEEQVKKLVENVPLGRLGRVEDIAAAVAFLCSPGAAYITGATLHVNGGMFMD